MEFFNDKMCWWCGRNETTDSHHLFRRSTNPELREESGNKIRLCRLCHNAATVDPVFEKLLQEVFYRKKNDPELSIEYISDQMKMSDMMPPRIISRYRMFLAGHYVYLSERYGQLELKRPGEIEQIRPDVKSDKRAEIKWEITERGQMWKRLKIQLKAVEKMLSALRTVHEQQQKEANLTF